MILELHAHTSKHSPCSEISPVQLIYDVQKKRLQGVIITEHHYLWNNDELDQLRKEAEIDAYFVLLAGQEVETDLGHILVFGAASTITEKFGITELRSSFPSAVLIWAHPFRYGKIPYKGEILNPALDAVEIFSGNQTIKENCFGLQDWHDYKFTAVSGSDVHRRGSAGSYPVLFDHPVTTVDDVCREIKKGRCRPLVKEILKSGSNISVTEIVFGTKGEDEQRNRAVIKILRNEKQWDKARSTAAITRTLYKHGFGGDVFRVPKVIEVNEETRTVIEEGQRGKSLHELLLNVAPSAGITYFGLAAEWLAKLHNAKLKITKIEDAKEKEDQRLDYYSKSFINTKNPFTKKAEELINIIRGYNKILFTGQHDAFIQNHGDYHPKNIIIGQDKMHDISTLFISVIDFGNTIMMPPSFDVGYFLSQFYNQFLSYPHILKCYTEERFLDVYRSHNKNIDGDFDRTVKIFKIRANVSIASYLIKVGKGESADMKAIIARSLSTAFL